MPARALSDLLVDFGSTGGSPTHPARPLLAAPSEPQPLRLNERDVEIRVADAVKQAEQAWQKRQAEDWGAQQAEIEARHASEMRRQEAIWAERIADAITERFMRIEQAAVEQTGAAVAQILAPLLSEPLRTKSITRLAEKLRAVLADGAVMRFRISGPAALYHALVAQLGDTVARLDFVESDDLDLTVAIDDALYVTRLRSWSTEMQRVLA